MKHQRAYRTATLSVCLSLFAGFSACAPSEVDEPEPAARTADELVTLVGTEPPVGAGFTLHGQLSLRTLDPSKLCAVYDAGNGYPAGLNTAPCGSTPEKFAIYSMGVAGGYNLCRLNTLMKRTGEAPNDQYYATCLIRQGTTEFLTWKTQVLSSRTFNTSNAFAPTVGPLRDDGLSVVGYIDSTKKLTRVYSAAGLIMLSKADGASNQKWELF